MTFLVNLNPEVLLLTCFLVLVLETHVCLLLDSVPFLLMLVVLEICQMISW